MRKFTVNVTDNKKETLHVCLLKCFCGFVFFQLQLSFVEEQQIMADRLKVLSEYHDTLPAEVSKHLVMSQINLEQLTMKLFKDDIVVEPRNVNNFAEEIVKDKASISSYDFATPQRPSDILLSPLRPLALDAIKKVLEFTPQRTSFQKNEVPVMEQTLTETIVNPPETSTILPLGNEGILETGNQTNTYPAVLDDHLTQTNNYADKHYENHLKEISPNITCDSNLDLAPVQLEELFEPLEIMKEDVCFDTKEKEKSVAPTEDEDVCMASLNSDVADTLSLGNGIENEQDRHASNKFFKLFISTPLLHVERSDSEDHHSSVASIVSESSGVYSADPDDKSCFKQLHVKSEIYSSSLFNVITLEKEDEENTSSTATVEDINCVSKAKSTEDLVTDDIIFPSDSEKNKENKSPYISPTINRRQFVEYWAASIHGNVSSKDESHESKEPNVILDVLNGALSVVSLSSVNDRDNNSNAVRERMQNSGDGFELLKRPDAYNELEQLQNNDVDFNPNNQVQPMTFNVESKDNEMDIWLHNASLDGTQDDLVTNKLESEYMPLDPIPSDVDLTLVADVSKEKLEVLQNYVPVAQEDKCLSDWDFIDKNEIMKKRASPVEEIPAELIDSVVSPDIFHILESDNEDKAYKIGHPKKRAATVGEIPAELIDSILLPSVFRLLEDNENETNQESGNGYNIVEKTSAVKSFTLKSFKLGIYPLTDKEDRFVGNVGQEEQVHKKGKEIGESEKDGNCVNATQKHLKNNKINYGTPAKQTDSIENINNSELSVSQTENMENDKYNVGKRMLIPCASDDIAPNILDGQDNIDEDIMESFGAKTTEDGDAIKTNDISLDQKSGKNVLPCNVTNYRDKNEYRSNAQYENMIKFQQPQNNLQFGAEGFQNKDEGEHKNINVGRSDTDAQRIEIKARYIPIHSFEIDSDDEVESMDEELSKWINDIYAERYKTKMYLINDVNIENVSAKPVNGDNEGHIPDVQHIILPSLTLGHIYSLLSSKQENQKLETPLEMVKEDVLESFPCKDDTDNLFIKFDQIVAENLASDAKGLTKNDGKSIDSNNVDFSELLSVEDGTNENQIEKTINDDNIPCSKNFNQLGSEHEERSNVGSSSGSSNMGDPGGIVENIGEEDTFVVSLDHDMISAESEDKAMKNWISDFDLEQMNAPYIQREIYDEKERISDDSGSGLTIDKENERIKVHRIKSESEAEEEDTVVGKENDIADGGENESGTTIKADKNENGITIKADENESGTTIKEDEFESGTTIKEDEFESGTTIKEDEFESGIKADEIESGTTIKEDEIESGTTIKEDEFESETAINENEIEIESAFRKGENETAGTKIDESGIKYKEGDEEKIQMVEGHGIVNVDENQCTTVDKVEKEIGEITDILSVSDMPSIVQRDQILDEVPSPVCQVDNCTISFDPLLASDEFSNSEKPSLFLELTAAEGKTAKDMAFQKTAEQLNAFLAPSDSSNIMKDPFLSGTEDSLVIITSDFNSISKNDIVDMPRSSTPHFSKEQKPQVHFTPQSAALTSNISWGDSHSNPETDTSNDIQSVIIPPDSTTSYSDYVLVRPTTEGVPIESTTQSDLDVPTKSLNSTKTDITQFKSPLYGKHDDNSTIQNRYRTENHQQELDLDLEEFIDKIQDCMLAMVEITGMINQEHKELSFEEERLTEKLVSLYVARSFSTKK